MENVINVKDFDIEENTSRYMVRVTVSRGSNSIVTDFLFDTYERIEEIDELYVVLYNPEAKTSEQLNIEYGTCSYRSISLADLKAYSGILLSALRGYKPEHIPDDAVRKLANAAEDYFKTYIRI